MDAPAAVVDYDATWPEIFDDIRERVWPAISDVALRVEHVGSTAVPGLAAKPIVDIDVVVADAPNVALTIERLGSIGYELQGDLGVPGREAFRPPPDGLYHHLYVVVEGDKAHRDHVDLRDYLRDHPLEAERYAVRKREIAHLLVADREAYTRGKSELVEQMLRRARSNTGSPVQIEERRSVRVILIDPDDRVLLFGALDPDDGRVVWFMPGGGIERGESVAETGRREILEETGIEVDRLDGPVWKREHDFTWDGRAIRSREWFMVARLSEFPGIDRTDMGSEELRYHVGARWMSLDEIRASLDLIAPRRLGELLPPILAGELPKDSIETGV